MFLFGTDALKQGKASAHTAYLILLVGPNSADKALGSEGFGDKDHGGLVHKRAVNGDKVGAGYYVCQHVASCERDGPTHSRWIALAYYLSSGKARTVFFKE
jgi:hypothetical protein